MHRKCIDCNRSAIVQVLPISFFPTYTKMQTGVFQKHSILEPDIFKKMTFKCCFCAKLCNNILSNLVLGQVLVVQPSRVKSVCKGET